MNRTSEALLSRQNMSNFKTLYVEGDLDYNIIFSFLNNNNLKDIRIIRIIKDKDEILGVSQMNDSLGAKKEIIKLIKQSNSDPTIEDGKYLGIVDLDFDLYFSVIENISNLIYTDKNSMESYLIDIDLFRILSEEKSCNSFNCFEENFDTYINNFSHFNKMFIFQLKYISELNENVISFDKIKFGSGIIKSDNTICTETIIRKCNNDYQIWQNSFNSKLNEIETLEQSKVMDKLVFFHGKYTLKYLINLFKNILNIYRQVDESTIINILKDKFIILKKCDNYDLFKNLIKFSQN